MSNVNGELTCLPDGTGTVVAHVSGTNVAVHAVASLNGQGAVELGKGNHDYTLQATFPQDTEVFLNVQRDGGEKLIRVLTVDCPQPTATPTTAPPSTVVPVVPANDIGTQTQASTPPAPQLPATDTAATLGALGAGSIILVGGIAITAVFGWLQRRREASFNN